MHGLILRTLQIFLQDTYGAERWERISLQVGIDPPEFEGMLHYATEVLGRVLEASAQELGKPVEVLLEDVGIYLVSHPNSDSVRRLLRFSGVDFIDFIYSLEDLPGRVQLAVSDLELPLLELRDHGDNRFDLRVIGPLSGFGHVLVGVLRAMADDYGALALLDHSGRVGEFEEITITVVENDFHAGRDFTLTDDTTRKRAG